MRSLAVSKSGTNSQYLFVIEFQVVNKMILRIVSIINGKWNKNYPTDLKVNCKKKLNFLFDLNL